MMIKSFYKYISLLLVLSLVSCYGLGNDDDGGDSGSIKSYQYNTPDEIDIFLDEIKLNYPDIISIETVGYSESGRMIKALVISDNPATIEGEPAVRLTGGIHGNEKMGIELLIRYIEYLTSNYSTDPEITDIVNNRYICIIPVLNPDGLAVNSRYNSRGVDLNRNFNDAADHWTYDSRSGSSPFSESESRALRDFSIPKNFDVSITYHTGAVLVNLPFDFAKENVQIPVQYALIQSYAKTYTKTGTFLSNPDMYISPYMDEGTINGGNWYVAAGTLQDWSYTQTGCLDLTIEVAKTTPDTEAGVQQVFMYNRDSITAYINRAGEDVFTGE